jgi:uncharacterized protein (AIM24 family)
LTVIVGITQPPWSCVSRASIRKAATGLMSTVKSGEGIVMQFTGPGTIHTQTRNPDALVT